MPKEPVSVTLDRDNLLWLRSLVTAGKRRSMSDALDALITATRLREPGAGDIRSVVGTIDIAADDPLLERADAFIRGEFDAAIGRRSVQPTSGAGPARGKRRRG